MYYHRNIVTELIINPQSHDGLDTVNVSESKRIPGTYLHGIAETNNQFDIFSIVGALPTCTGIYPCTILGRKENDNEGTFYLWVCSNLRTHGLVVLNRDKASIEYAESLYRKRATSI